MYFVSLFCIMNHLRIEWFVLLFLRCLILKWTVIFSLWSVNFLFCWTRSGIPNFQILAPSLDPDGSLRWCAGAGGEEGRGANNELRGPSPSSLHSEPMPLHWRAVRPLTCSPPRWAYAPLSASRVAALLSQRAAQLFPSAGEPLRGESRTLHLQATRLPRSGTVEEVVK
jgi:hypothetical protein